jgi:hypothetical protein
MLLALEAAEGRDLQTAALRLTELGISGQDYLVAQLEAFSWAAKIHPAS